MQRAISANPVVKIRQNLVYIDWIHRVCDAIRPCPGLLEKRHHAPWLARHASVVRASWRRCMIIRPTMQHGDMISKHIGGWLLK